MEIEIADNVTPLEYVAMVKVLDNETGDIQMHTRTSDGLNDFEAIGMLISALDDIRSFIRVGDDD